MFKNGTSVKNWASDHVGGVSYAIGLIAIAYGAMEVLRMVALEK